MRVIIKSLAAASAVIIAGFGASTPALAQGSLADQLATCARIEATAGRLACFDSVASHNPPSGSQGTTQEAPATSRAATAPAAPPAQPATERVSSAGFGAEQVERATRSSQAPREASELTARVTTVKELGPGIWQVGVEDGALWRMTERSTTFQPPEVRESIVIRKGALGGYLMRVGRQSAVRVTRVR